MKRRFLVVGGALLVGALVLVALGSARYGGPGGLLLRVRAEIAAQRPRPVYVPTPLPTATGRTAAAVAPTVEPTPSPVPARTSTALRNTPSPLGATPVVSTPLASATPLPTGTPPPTVAPPPTATPPPAPPTPGPAVELTGLRHAWQTWNNCGPATLAMYLSYWGSGSSQEDIRRAVRPNPEDKHAGADELADFARGQGLHALVRIDGSAERLRQLLAAGLPVMVSTWHEDEPGDGMGHYRLIVGYDEGAREWLLYDSLAATASDRNAPYTPLRLSYDAFEPLWLVFNRRYVLVYSDAYADAVRAILGDDMDDGAMWQGALARAEEESAADAGNPFHWFNLGTDLVALERYGEAAAAYDRARQLGLPWRMLWYQFGPFSAYYHTGRYDEVVALADATLRVTTHIEELHYWRGMALAALGDARGARASLQRAIQLRPGYPDAVQALEGLG